MQKPSHRSHCFDEFTLDLMRGCLLRGREEIKLRPKSFEVLKYLVQNHGRLISKSELIQAVWVDTAVTDDSVVQCLKDIRHALRDEAQQIIKTVHGRGYIFDRPVKDNGSGPITTSAEETRAVAVVIEDREIETNDDSATHVGTARLVTRRKSLPFASAEYLVSEVKLHKRGLAIAAAVTVLAFAAVAYLYFNRKNSQIPGGEAIDALAVLPFVNESSDSNTQYLSEGISDSLINSLSQLPALKVQSLASVMRYQGKQIDPHTVGQELGVRAVLIGRFTQRGDDLLISTELVDVRDNRRLWGDHYDRKLSDIFVVQTSIAQEISQSLRLRLSAPEQKQLAKHYTENTEAYRLYNLGMYGMRGGQAKERLEESVKYFEQARKIDPHYTLAYVGLADVYHQLGFRGFWIPKDAWQKAEWAALKAVELDDNLAEAHEALAVEKQPRDWAGAEKEFKRALDLDPNSAEMNRGYAVYLAYSARTAEALAYAKRGEELDSKNPTGLRPAYLANIYFIAREYDTAIAGYRRALEKNPNNAQFHFFLGEAYVAKEMYQDGVAELQKAVALDNAPERWDRYPMLAYAFAASGKRDEALKILDEQKRLAKQSYISPYNLAIIYTGLGDKDRAFEVLNKAVDEDVYVMNQFPGRPMFDRLRSDPRYMDLLRRMNRAS